MVFRILIRTTGLFIAALVIAQSTCFALVAKASSESVAYRKAIYSLPLTFDPIKMNDVSSLLVSEMIYEGLLRISNNYGYETALAESWTTSADGRVLTFKLRKNRKFHNGSKVTARDVVASLNRAAGKGSRVAPLYSCILGATEFASGRSKSVAGLKAIAEDVVEIRLTHAFPPFMYVLAGATAKVLPSSRLMDPDFFKAPIGSGPFRFVGEEKAALSKALVLQSVKDHPRLSGNISKLTLIEMTEPDARKAAASGTIDDLANYPLTGTEDVFGAGQKLSTVSAQTWVIGLNSRRRPFRSASIRLAFQNSFDSEGFRIQFYPDAEPAFGFVPPGFPGHRSAKVTRKIVAGSTNSKELVEIAIPNELAQSKEMSRFIETSMASRGWKVKVRPMAWSELMKGYEAKSFQAFLVSMNMDYPDSEFLFKNFESTNSDNYSGIKSPEIDQLLERARETTDRAVRKTTYEKLADKIESLAPTVNLFHPRTHVWANSCVSGLEPNVLSDAYIDYAKVRIETGCKRSELAKQ